MSTRKIESHLFHTDRFIGWQTSRRRDHVRRHCSQQDKSHYRDFVRLSPASRIRAEPRRASRNRGPGQASTQFCGSGRTGPGLKKY